MTAQLGVNVAYGADPAALAATGARFIRVVYRDNLPLRPWINQLKNLGVETMFVFDSSPESLSDNEDQWNGRLTVARSNYGDLVKIMQPMNEPDGGPPASWVMPWQRVNCGLMVARSVFSREQGFTLVAPGLVSGDTNWPANLRFDLCDELSAHLYAQFIDTRAARENLVGILERYRAYGLPLSIDEFDSRTPGLSAYFRDYPGVTRAAVMCWDDGMTESTEGIRLGLLQNATAMASFLAATGGPVAVDTPPVVPTPAPPPTFVLGFKAFHDAYPMLLADPLENERGGIPGFSQQLTSTGVLTAANIQGLGWQILFWDRVTGARWRFDGSRAEQIA